MGKVPGCLGMLAGRLSGLGLTGFSRRRMTEKNRMKIRAVDLDIVYLRKRREEKQRGKPKEMERDGKRWEGRREKEERD